MFIFSFFIKNLNFMKIKSAVLKTPAKTNNSICFICFIITGDTKNHWLKSLIKALKLIVGASEPCSNDSL